MGGKHPVATGNEIILNPDSLFPMGVEVAEAEKEVEDHLKKVGLEYRRATGIDGLRFDFVVANPPFLVEVKKAPRSRSSVRSLSSLAKKYATFFPGEPVFVVPKLPRRLERDQVVSVSGFARLIAQRQKGAATNEKVRNWTQLLSKIVATPSPREVFVAMPYDESFEDTYLVSIREAAKKRGLICNRVDNKFLNQTIIQSIHDGIERCEAVVADVSGANPNVMYEVGVARAKGRPVAQISSTPLKKLPFDISAWPTLFYRKGQTKRLVAPLAKALSDFQAGQTSYVL